MRRFTVSLEEEEYDRLKEIADRHRPRLSLQYVVQYAIQHLLRDAQDPRLVLRLGDPLRRERK